MTQAMSQIRLAPNGLIAADAMFAHLANHAIPGAETADPVRGCYRRVVVTEHGPVAVTVQFDRVVGGEHNDGVLVNLTLPDEGARGASSAEVIRGEVAGIVRRWLDLDSDVALIERRFAADPILGPLVRARPGLRVVKYPDEFEAAVMTVLGQQVSVAAGRTFGGRLVAAFGTPGPDGLRVFPSAERLVGVPQSDLRSAVGLTNARAHTVLAVAGAFANGLELRPADGDYARVRADLLRIRGVGPWTVDYLTVRVMGDPDGFAAGDLVLRRALGGVSAREALELAESWRPWRAYALVHLWTSQTFAR